MRNRTNQRPWGLSGLASLLVLFLLSALVGGCNGSRELDPTGAYKGDRILYEADRLLVQVDDALTSAIEFGKRNPQFVDQNPSFKAFLERITNERDQWFSEFFEVRDAYHLLRSASNQTALENKMAWLRLILTQAQQGTLAKP